MIRESLRNPKRFGLLLTVFVVGLLSADLAPATLWAQQSSPPARMYSLSVGSPFTSGAWLGVELKDVTADLVRSMKLPGEYGAIVAKVEPDSPAAKAGLEVNDVILDFGSWKVWSAAQLAQLLRETPPGRTVEVRVSRAGKMRSFQVKLGARKEHAFMPMMRAPHVHVGPPLFNFRPPRNYHFNFAFGGPVLGITGETLTPQLAAFFGVKQGSGVLVESVDKNSPAAKSGLEAGDCIVKVDSSAVASMVDLRHALAQVSGSRVTLSVVRAKQERTLAVTLEPGWRPDHNLNRRLWREWPGVHLQLLGQKAQLRELQRQMQQEARSLQRQIRELERKLPQMQKEAQAQINRQLPAIEKQAAQLRSQAPQLEKEARQLEQKILALEQQAGSV